MTVGELQRRISAREYIEWMAYYNIEPWGDERADLRAGIVASTVANVNRDRKQRPRPYRPKDFMPKFGARQQAPPQMTWQEHYAKTRAWSMAIAKQVAVESETNEDHGNSNTG